MKMFPSGQQLRKQAEAIRRKIAAAQNECALKTFEGRSGAVLVKASGRGEICAVEFLEAGLEPADLAEQTMAAANEALRKARKSMDEAAAAAGAAAGL